MFVGTLGARDKGDSNTGNDDLEEGQSRQGRKREDQNQETQNLSKLIWLQYPQAFRYSR